MWDMIKIGNLILRTLALVELTNSRYFERDVLLFRNLICGILNYESNNDHIIDNYLFAKIFLNLMSYYKNEFLKIIQYTQLETKQKMYLT